MSALRETSVAIAVFIGWWFMGDPMSKRRVAGAVLVLIGRENVAAADLDDALLGELADTLAKEAMRPNPKKKVPPN